MSLSNAELKAACERHYVQTCHVYSGCKVIVGSRNVTFRRGSYRVAVIPRIRAEKEVAAGHTYIRT